MTVSTEFGNTSVLLFGPCLSVFSSYSPLKYRLCHMHIILLGFEHHDQSIASCPIEAFIGPC